MGMTLPVLTRVLRESDPIFGSVLGRLYGWNTVGAVAGVLLAELTLIRYLGVVGSGVMASVMNILVAIGAWSLFKQHPRFSAPPQPLVRSSREARTLLTAAFLSGAALLALEVVWFRFLSLFISTNYLAFALMLATVLAGIGTGGLVASKLCRLFPGVDVLWWFPSFWPVAP